MDNCILMGTEPARKIYFEYGTYLKVLQYAKGGGSDGCRGVLLGEKEGDITRITAVAQAIYTGEEGIEAPSFTSDSWNRIRGEIAAYYKELKILGSFSSHIDITPSEQDTIFQQGFFAEEGSLLFVFDPVSNAEAMYTYAQDKLDKLAGFYLYDQYSNGVNLGIKERFCRDGRVEYETRSKFAIGMRKKMAGMMAAVMIAFALLVVSVAYMAIQGVQNTSKFGEMNHTIDTMRSEIDELIKLTGERASAPIASIAPEVRESSAPSATPEETYPTYPPEEPTNAYEDTGYGYGDVE